MSSTIGFAALLRQRVGIGLQPFDPLLARQRLAGGLAVELGDHPVELVERAAEALPILLREFRAIASRRG